MVEGIVDHREHMRLFPTRNFLPGAFAFHHFALVHRGSIGYRQERRRTLNPMASLLDISNPCIVEHIGDGILQLRTVAPTERRHIQDLVSRGPCGAGFRAALYRDNNRRSTANPDRGRPP